MTLIQSASLLITPTGFKTGDIYTAIPNNTTSGDFQFTRNTPSASMFTSQSQFVTRSLDVPRLTYNSGSTYPSILIERQGLNELGLSGKPYVTGSGTTARTWRDGVNYLLQTQSITPIAGLPATRFTYTGSRVGTTSTSDITGSLAYRVGAVLSGSGYYTFSTVVRKGNAQNLWMYFSSFGWYSGSNTSLSASNPQMVFTFDDKTFVSTFSSAYYTASYTQLDDAGSYKLNITFNHSGSATQRFIWMVPTTGSTGTANNRRYQSASLYHDIAYVQLERGFGSTSYIEAPNSESATRGADSLFRTSSSDIIGQQEGTVYVQANLPTAPISGSNPVILGLSYPIPSPTTPGTFIGAGPFVYICREESSKITVHVSGSSHPTDTVLLESSLAYSGSVKIAVAYSSSDSKLYINGAPVATDINALTFGNPLSRIDIGSWYGTQQGNASIDYAALWKTRLTDARLAEITS